MTKHTPGPWEQFEHDWRSIIDPGGWNVAEVIDQVDGRANARLIAAAPDLLETLKALADAPGALSSSALARVEEAIAKAEGE